MPDGPAADALLAQMLAPQETLAEIAARPVRRGGYQAVPSARPAPERWAGATMQSQRAILAEWGVTVVVRKPIGKREAARLEIDAAGSGDSEARAAIMRSWRRRVAVGHSSGVHIGRRAENVEGRVGVREQSHRSGAGTP